MRKLLLLTTGILAFSCAGAQTEGVPDSTYGINAVYTFVNPQFDEVHDMEVLPDGSIIAVGYANSMDSAAVWKIQPNGGLDLTFGIGGVKKISASNGQDVANAVTVMPDGRILICGYTMPSTYKDLLIARLLPTGQIDPTFNGNGYLSYSVNTLDDEAFDIDFASSNKVVVVGNTKVSSTFDMLVIRLFENGSFDNSFDSDGILTVNIQGNNDNARKVKVLAGDKIIVAGDYFNSSTFDVFLVRYMINGAVDNGFGSGGWAKFPVYSQSDYVKGLHVNADGSILVTGAGDSGSDYYLIAAKLTSMGVLDGTFGTGGKYVGTTAKEDGSFITTQPDGKILITGTSGFSTTARYCYWRLLANGTLDPVFGTGGKLVLNVGGDNQYVTSGGLFDIYGYAAGYSWNGSDYNYSISRIRYCNPPTITTDLVNTEACEGSSTSLNIVVAGTGSFSYQWYFNSMPAAISGPSYTIPTVTSGEAGDYNIVVTGGCGSTFANSSVVTLSVNPSPVVAVMPGSISVCNGNMQLFDGTPTGGTPPYSHLWTGDAGQLSQTNIQNPVFFASVPGIANMTYTVTDSKSCTASESITVTVNESPIVTFTDNDVLCFGEATGSVNSTPSGGAGGYTFQWNYPATTQNLINISAGTYTLTVTDANGCTVVGGPVTVSEPPVLSVNILSGNPICTGVNDGFFDLTVSGGAGPYSYSWVGPASFGSLMEDISGLEEGLYFLTVTDANACVEDTFMVLAAPPVITIAGMVTDADCAGNGGWIDLMVSGGVPAYTYFWSNLTNEDSLANVYPGTYSVTVTDVNGCMVSDAYTIGFLSNPALLHGNLQYSGGFLPSGSAEVLLFRENTSGGVSVMDTVNTFILDPTGFHFIDLLPGNYFLKANVLDQVTFPGIMNSFFDTAFVWMNADTIPLGCDDDTTVVFNMYEMPVNPMPGCDLHGTVTELTISKSGIAGGKAAGEPVPGAEILVEQEPTDLPVQATQTDSNGEFVITDLQPGTGYTIIVDIPGVALLSTYEDFSIDAGDTAITGFDFYFDTTATGGVWVDTSMSFVFPSGSGLAVECTVFPVPFNDVLNYSISLDSPQKLSVKLVDAFGRMVAEDNLGTITGTVVGVLRTDQEIASGSYFLVIRAGNSFMTKKVIRQE